MKNKLQKFCIVFSIVFFSFAGGIYFAIYLLFGIVTNGIASGDTLRALEAINNIHKINEKKEALVKQNSIEIISKVYQGQLESRHSNYIYRKFYYNPVLIEKIEKAEKELPELKETLDIARKKANR